MKTFNRCSTLGLAAALTFAATFTLSSCSKSSTKPNAPSPDPGSTPTVSTVTLTGPYPRDLELQDGDLYWSEAGEEPINVLPAGGGSPEVLANKVGAVEGLAVAGQEVFWIETRTGVSPSGCAGAVIRVLSKISGATGLVTQLEVGDACSGGATDVIVDGGDLYWVTSTASPTTYSIRRNPTTGGPSTVVASSSAMIGAIAVQGGYLYWIQNAFPGNSGAVLRKPVAGGSPDTLVSGFVSRTYSFGVNSTSVFYTTAALLSGDTLKAAPLDGSPPTALAAVTDTPTKLQADDTNLYWIDNNSVNALPLAGGAPASLAPAADTPLDILLRTDDVLWTETTGIAHGETGVVKRVPKIGGAASVIHQGGDAPRRVAVDNSHVYWTEGGLIGEIEGFGRVARVPITGGTEETIVSGVSSDSPQISIGDADVFIADRWRVKRVPRAGGIVETLAEADDGIADLVNDGTYVYWIEGPTGTLRRVPVGGGAVTTVLMSTGSPIARMRVANGTLYWLERFDTIKSVLTSGGSAQTVASGLAFSEEFVVDDANVYYSENDNGNISRKPLSGGSAVVLANGNAGYNVVTQDIANVYWIDLYHVGKVAKAVAGGTYIVPGGLEADEGFAASIVADSVNVYWTEPPIQEIRKAPKNW